MSLTVKCYLEKKDGDTDNHINEIRRFNITEDTVGSFLYLNGKIATIFPSLRDGHFSLYWKDSDGDLVLFSTDEELLEALGFISDSLLKIYIKTNETASSTSTVQQTQEAHGKVHQGVICDGCNGLVKGIRYKCMECDDYDLCTVCEQKGTHPEHNMMKINKPSRAPFYAVPPHRGHGMHRHGRFASPGGHGEFAPPPHFRRWMRRFMRRWHSENTPGCPMEQDSPDDELSPPEGSPYMCPAVSPRNGARGRGQWRNRSMGSPGKCSPRKFSPSKCSPRSEQAAKNDSASTKKDEVVIDLTAGNDKEAERSNEGQNVTAEESSTEEITSATEKIVLDDPCEQIVVDDPSQDVVQADPSQEPAVCEFENDRQPPEPARLDIQHDNRDRRTEEGDNSWLLLNVAPNGGPELAPASEPHPPSPVQSAPVQEPAEQGAGQAVTTSGTRTGSTKAQSGTTRTQTVQFQIPPQIFYPPSNPRVAEALQQMMAMGFNNDGGWLTRLLEDKNGDIIQVLDAIKPQPGRARETNGGYMA
ncbi:sequestosome-1-like [Mercenaria mercenaria]|uniref:sequestosome-1-like n=1 Tax=Mercenaria mercenaria TaxID=6596 RepID=UPI00234F3181|nr:sequestosome-1-like [Mercenaria mercenaria]XP_053398818.1 sequestosome-1-like [Mercenaria mercenaria]